MSPRLLLFVGAAASAASPLCKFENRVFHEILGAWKDQLEYTVSTVNDPQTGTHTGFQVQHNWRGGASFAVEVMPDEYITEHGQLIRMNSEEGGPTLNGTTWGRLSTHSSKDGPCSDFAWGDELKDGPSMKIKSSWWPGASPALEDNCTFSGPGIGEAWGTTFGPYADVEITYIDNTTFSMETADPVSPGIPVNRTLATIDVAASFGSERPVTVSLNGVPLFGVVENFYPDHACKQIALWAEEDRKTGVQIWKGKNLNVMI
jgi:hypothetical protein